MSGLDKDSLQRRITRRDALGWLKKLTLVAGASATMPTLLNAQETRRYKEAGRDIIITTEAEERMNEWGIKLQGSQISGPSTFTLWPDHGSVKINKKFPGICLTRAKSVHISILQGSGERKYLQFRMDSDHKEGNFFVHDFLTFSDELNGTHEYHLSPRPSNEGYVEGACEVVVS